MNTTARIEVFHKWLTNTPLTRSIHTNFMLQLAPSSKIYVKRRFLARNPANLKKNRLVFLF